MIFGIDTASVGGNKRVNWTKARADGAISFAILRSNYGTVTDTFFCREWERVLAAGIVAGAYMFLRFPSKKCASVASPTDQAMAMIRILDRRLESGRDLPPAMDVEFPGTGAAETGMTAAHLLEGVREAWRVLKNHYGVPPIIYTSGRVWKEDLKNLPAPDLVESPLWLARYPFKAGPAVRNAARVMKAAMPAVPPPWGDKGNYWIHQYQGDATALPGFPTGNVDMNRFRSASLGDRGGNVGWIQRRLGMAKVTACLDDETEHGVRQVQAARGLTVDGIVGPRTFAALCWA